MSTFRQSSNSISIEVSVFVYKDANYPNGNMYIAYCPELDLAGYDTTNRKARKSFEYVLKDYLDYTLQNGTLESDLLKHGWRKLKDGKIVKPSLSSMLKQPQFKSVLSQNTYNKYPVPVLV